MLGSELSKTRLGRYVYMHSSEEGFLYANEKESITTNSLLALTWK